MAVGQLLEVFSGVVGCVGFGLEPLEPPLVPPDEGGRSRTPSGGNSVHIQKAGVVVVGITAKMTV